MIGAPAPPQRVAFVYDFTGTDGAAWDAAKMTTSGNDSVVDISSNAGRFRFGAVTGSYLAYSRAFALLGSKADVDLTFKITCPNLEHYPCITIRGSGSWSGASEFVAPVTGWTMNLNIQGNSVSINEVAAGVSTNRGSATPPQSTATGGTFKGRFQALGNVIRCKLWEHTNNEPGSWLISYTDDGSTPGPGVVQLGAQTGSATSLRTVTFEDVVCLAL